MKIDAIDEFEIKAEAFRLMTGHMAPGKDPAIESYAATFEVRAEEFERWLKENGECARAMLIAVRRILPDEEQP